MMDISLQEKSYDRAVVSIAVESAEEEVSPALETQSVVYGYQFYDEDHDISEDGYFGPVFASATDPAVTDFENMLDWFEDRIFTLEDELREIEHELDSVHWDYNDAEDEIRTLGNRVEELEAEVEALEVEIDSLREDDD